MLQGQDSKAQTGSTGLVYLLGALRSRIRWGGPLPRLFLTDGKRTLIGIQEKKRKCRQGATRSAHVHIIPSEVEPDRLRATDLSGKMEDNNFNSCIIANWSCRASKDRGHDRKVQLPHLDSPCYRAQGLPKKQRDPYETYSSYVVVGVAVFILNIFDNRMTWQELANQKARPHGAVRHELNLRSKSGGESGDGGIYYLGSQPIRSQ